MNPRRIRPGTRPVEVEHLAHLHATSGDVLTRFVDVDRAEGVAAGDVRIASQPKLW